MMLNDKQRASIAKYRELKAKMAGVDSLTLELMRHPDATVEQIMEVHEMQVDMHQKFRRVMDAMIKARLDRYVTH
jgi:hypothetical protein